MLGVYPRVCGGTVVDLDDQEAEEGLSPRVRGNRRRAVYPDLRLGSIPACAGEPSLGPGKNTRCQVYPRVCGGTVIELFGGFAYEGLSPRVRGNRDLHQCARASTRVYPRVCGGTQVVSHISALSAGLSPRVRGNRGKGRTRNGRLGSIPACAGEPVSSWRTVRIIRVYPRVCGGTQAARWL